MVVAVFLSLAGVVKTNLSKTKVDSTVFSLHYRWTTTFCFLACALVATSDFIGKPIECLGAEKAHTTYCWVSSTYTLNTSLTKSSFYEAHDSVYFGLGTYDEDKHTIIFHSYYQWIPFILFLQGCLFYLPHLIWKAIEGKQLDNLLQGLNVLSLDEESQMKKKQTLVKHLRLSTGLNKKYVLGYFTCEILNFVNVIGQIFLLDKFFGGMFLDLGSKVFSLPTKSDESRHDALIYRFPRVTKCHFQQFGASGSIETRDFMCILPQNLLNEKIFLIMWMWFIFLSCCTGLQLIYRLAIFKYSILRVRLLEKRGKVSPTFEFHELVRDMSLGDFFLLYTVAWNVDTLCLRDILNLLTYRVQQQPENNMASIPQAASLNGAYCSHLDGLDTLDMRLRKKAQQESEEDEV